MISQLHVIEPNSVELSRVKPNSNGSYRSVPIDWCSQHCNSGIFFLCVSFHIYFIFRRHSIRKWFKISFKFHDNLSQSIHPILKVRKEVQTIQFYRRIWINKIQCFNICNNEVAEHLSLTKCSFDNSSQDDDDDEDDDWWVKLHWYENPLIWSVNVALS